MDLEPEKFRALPAFKPASELALKPGDTIRVGIVRPFH